MRRGPGPGVLTAAGLLLSTTALALWGTPAARPETTPAPHFAVAGPPAPATRPTVPADAERMTPELSVSSDSAQGAQDPTVQGLQTSDGRRPYPGDPERESALVADQDRRLVQIRTVDALVHGRSTVTTPYRLNTGTAYSLVLTARRAPYTIGDLLALAPRTFVRQPGGAYLLSENIFIRPGATLSLASPGALVLHLASDSKGFSSLVNDGGRLLVTGTERAPAQVTSWDRVRGHPDDVTRDGRAYLRSIGGQVTMAHVRMRDLGFWSGRTGGLALTGTDHPSTGAPGAPRTPVRRANRDAFTLKPATGAKAVKGSARARAAQTLPVPELSTADPPTSLVSATLDDVTTDGNAFGVFLENARGAMIRRSSFSHSLVDGVVMHRFVTSSVVANTSAVDNGGDGIVLSRATTGVKLQQVTASDNARNGISISGVPLASGPSARATAVKSYGDNTVNDSTASGNARYGVEVIGGDTVRVANNDLVGNEVGIVVRDGARSVTVTGNDVENPSSQGIAVRDGVAGSTVSANTVRGGVTGISLRDARADIGHNTLTGSQAHGITVVGNTSRTTVEGNTVRGATTGIYLEAAGGDIRHNVLTGPQSRGIMVVANSTVTTVDDNAVSGATTGIYLRHADGDVQRNILSGPQLHGITIDGNTGRATVEGNVVNGGATGIYLRDAGADVRNNTLTNSQVHGISILGDASRTTVDRNTIAGRGSTPIDVRRAVALPTGRTLNDTSGWSVSRSFVDHLKTLLQPLNAMWLLVALLVLVTAVRGRRRPRGFTHPYADKAPVSSSADVLRAHGNPARS